MFESGSMMSGEGGKSPHGKLNRMEINGGGNETKSMYVQTICREFLGIRNPWLYFSDRYTKKDQIIMFTATLVLVCIFAFTVSKFAAPSPPPVVLAPALLGSDLRYLLHKSFMLASKEGSLVQTNVSSPVEIMESQGIEFLVMTLRDSSFKSRASLSAAVHPPDPFVPSHLPSSHVITPIGSSHTLILNKFYTINEHSLLITNTFERQEALLTLSDIEAWFFCVSSIKALGFYNSNSVAGASQLHKHMQLVPLNEIRNLSPSSTYTLPIDISIRSKVIQKEWKYFFPFPTSASTGSSSSTGTDRVHRYSFYGSDITASTDTIDSSASFPDVLAGASQDNVYQIPEYRFKHAIVALIAAEEWEEVKDSAKISASYGDYLLAAYRQLLWELHLTSSITSRAGVAMGGYNVLLTERWMLMVPRQKESFIVTSGIGSRVDSISGNLRSSMSSSNINSRDNSGMGIETEEVEVEVASVNGLGFAGLLLARSPLARGVIRDISPLAVLQGVSIPTEQ